MARILHVIPHTHWDREWYEPFEVVRYRLVKVVDQVLDVLETDDAFRHFTLDGQTAAIEDYLDIRPGAEADVAAAVSGGRLSIGPFRVLTDQALTSGETLVRNLQQGAATCARLGGRMPVGYLPDPFGHAAQMPQLLRLAGIDAACVWRGVPRGIDRTVFRWEAPDGSWVKTLYLPLGYGHGAALPLEPEHLRARAVRIVEDLQPFEPGEVVAVPSGSDHTPITDGLAAALAAAATPELSFRIGSLQELLDETSIQDVPVWRGELRSSARANLLPGVLSARLPLKQAEARTTIELERYAEPLAVLGAIDPGRVLERAWRRVVENAGHDSITGCGIDEVAADVEARYVEAGRIASAVSADGLEALANALGVDGAAASHSERVVVFNPTPESRGGVVEVTATVPDGPDPTFVTREGAIAHAQVLQITERIALDMDVRGDQLLRLVPLVASRKLADLYVNDLEVVGGRPVTLRLTMSQRPAGSFDVESNKRRVEELARRRPRARFRVVGTGPPMGRMLIDVPAVPGLGWTTLHPATTDAGADGTAGAAARADGSELSNDILLAKVDARGRVSLTSDAGTFDGLLGLDDGGDAGDEYTYAPPDGDTLVAEPDGDVVVTPLRDGPVEAALRVALTYRIPAGLDATGTRRSRRHVPMPVIITLRLRAREPFLRASIEVDNRATDHRVRALFPVPFRCDGSAADGPFSVDERGLVGEGGPNEAGSPVFPSRRWASVSDGERGLSVIHLGSPAYEVSPDGRMLAVTLLRSIGWLSRHGTAVRAGPAGPVIATPGAQLPGPHRVELAIYPHRGRWDAGAVHAAAERAALPLRATVVSGSGGSTPPHAGALSLSPTAVRLSTVTRAEDAVHVRVWNAGNVPVDASIEVGERLPRTRAHTVDLLGETLRGLEIRDGVLHLPLRAWEIATIALQ